MAQNHIALQPPPANARSGRPRAAARPHEAHVVVATQNLSRMSGAIQALIQAGYLVTAYASPTRPLPRCTEFMPRGVTLLSLPLSEANLLRAAATLTA